MQEPNSQVENNRLYYTIKEYSQKPTLIHQMTCTNTDVDSQGFLIDYLLESFRESNVKNKRSVTLRNMDPS